MAVRFKLDRCGIKLSLRQWSGLTADDRRGLLLAPCHTAAEMDAYRAGLLALVAERTHSQAQPLAAPPEALWEQASRTPAAIRAFAGEVGVPAPSDEDWARLTQLQRFALLKLSRDNHDNINFIPALKEWGLIGREGSITD